jgi:hypothetical protein
VLEQVHQAALAEREPEQVGERRLQPLVGQRLEGLETGGNRMQPRAEWCSPRRLRHGCDHPRAAGRAVHRQPSMLGDGRRDLRQLDLLGHAHDLGRNILVQADAAAHAAIRTMIDDRTGLVTHHAATTLMTGLRPAGLRLLPPLLAVGRGRLRRRARGLRRALHPQHHLILSLSKDRSAPRDSAAQDRFGPSYEGISETQPAQGGG